MKTTLLLLGLILTAAQAQIPNVLPVSKFAVYNNTFQPSAVPGLHTSGKYIHNEKNEQVVLRGVCIPDPEKIFKKFYFNFKDESMNGTGRGLNGLRNMIGEAVKQWKAKIIRIPVNLDPNEKDSTDGWRKAHDVYLETYLQPAVQACIDNGAYAIIDFHYTGVYSDSFKDTTLIPFWSKISSTYKNNPNVLYEIFSEPLCSETEDENDVERRYSWDKWYNYINPVIDNIRNAQDMSIILVGGPYYNHQISGALQRPFQQSNIVYTQHIYPGSISDVDNNIDMFNSYPVFVSEWGWQLHYTDKFWTIGSWRYFGSPFSHYLDANCISWTAFSFDYQWEPGLFDGSYWKLTGYDPEVQADTGFGTYVYAYLTNKLKHECIIESVPVVEKQNGEYLMPTLDQNYPNPFSPITYLRYSIAGKSKVTMIITDMLGKEVARPVDGLIQDSGVYQIDFKASHLPSGSYICRLITGRGEISRRMIKVVN